VTDLCEVVITAPDPDWLLDLTRQLVNEGLCASAHNFAPVRSIYRWHGEVHERTEGRASLHTRLDRVNEIVARVKDSHPYEVPGISARPIVGGSQDYLEWIASETEDVRIVLRSAQTGVEGYRVVSHRGQPDDYAHTDGSAWAWREKWRIVAGARLRMYDLIELPD
jgi:periplasmic divalent cation tolerance protein